MGSKPSESHFQLWGMSDKNSQEKWEDNLTLLSQLPWESKPQQWNRLRTYLADWSIHCFFWTVFNMLRSVFAFNTVFCLVFCFFSLFLYIMWLFFILLAQPSEMHFNISSWLGRIKRQNSDKKSFFDVFFMFPKGKK